MFRAESGWEVCFVTIITTRHEERLLDAWIPPPECPVEAPLRIGPLQRQAATELGRQAPHPGTMGGLVWFCAILTIPLATSPSEMLRIAFRILAKEPGQGASLVYSLSFGTQLSSTWVADSK